MARTGARGTEGFGANWNMAMKCLLDLRSCRSMALAGGRFEFLDLHGSSPAVWQGGLYVIGFRTR